MKLRILAVTMLLVLWVTAVAQAPAADRTDSSRPLNLSLPRELKLTDLMPTGSDALYDPLDRDSMAQRRGGQGGNLLRYGRGYEARQRQATSNDVAVGGSSGGMAGGGIGGRVAPGGNGGRREGAGRGR